MADGEPELTDDLKRLLMRKRELETELVDVERRIYALEESYIQDTAALGNIIKGWSGYLSSRSLEQVKQITRKVKDSDRLFTLSSTSGFPSNTEDEPAEDERPRKKQKRKRRD